VEEVLADLGPSPQSHGRFAAALARSREGVMHMAIGAVINAAWDMAARAAGKPVWQLMPG